jgi:D-alanyl-D-alanine carboxypeptidase/D-alanyl-D-alanine-endopeptidase (penicillin-binding protein 4)
VLAARDSAPLAQDLQVIAKVSQNLHAEITLRLAGRAKGRNPTLDSALDVLRGVLTQAGIEPDEYSFTDGSGLSRDNLVTPQAVVKLLQFAGAQPWAQQFQDMLPVAGVDGTLRFRYVNTPAAGHIFAKTGTLGHVNALSGYATTLEGHRLAFSIFTNHHKLTSRGAEQIMDQIMEAVVNDAPPPKKHKRARKAAKSKAH